jgi:hypothetical protein
LLKTGFFRQVRELKIQRKNPGGALHIGEDFGYRTVQIYYPPWPLQGIRICFTLGRGRF